MAGDGAIPGPEAWRRVATQPRRRWNKGVARFGSVPVDIDVTPKFRLESDARVFCIGSCFARNIEEHLIYHGVRLLSRRIVSPKAEFGARPNGLVNKFTAPSMLNELRWVLDDAPLPAPERLFCPTGDDAFLDLQLTPGTSPVTLARAAERRRYLREDYFLRMLAADVVILTLGLDEIWHDADSGLFLNAPPPLAAVNREPGRYSVSALGFADNLAALEEIRALLRRANPHVRFVVSVSPVALDVSFVQADPAMATVEGKSVLRAVAGAFARAHDDVDYFPSYEMVTLSPRADVYVADCRHVADHAVGAIMRRFLASYMGREETEPHGFVEMSYLSAHPDVEDEVRAGTWESGFEHWLARGEAEGRALRPLDGPSARMVKLGLG